MGTRFGPVVDNERDLIEAVEAVREVIGEGTVITNGSGVLIADAVNNVANALDRIADALRGDQ